MTAYKFYIAGPMAGIPNFNYDTFNSVEYMLMTDGYGTVNPAALDMVDGGLEHSGDLKTGKGVTDLNRAAFLQRDFAELALCDGIVLLPGWSQSTGANCELLASQIMGLDVWVWDEKYLVPEAAPRLMPLMGLVRDHVAGVAAAQVERGVTM